jgi:hypothetical protein
MHYDIRKYLNVYFLHLTTNFSYLIYCKLEDKSLTLHV